MLYKSIPPDYGGVPLRWLMFSLGTFLHEVSVEARYIGSTSLSGLWGSKLSLFGFRVLGFGAKEMVVSAKCWCGNMLSKHIMIFAF